MNSVVHRTSCITLEYVHQSRENTHTQTRIWFLSTFRHCDSNALGILVTGFPFSFHFFSFVAKEGGVFIFLFFAFFLLF